MRNLISISAGGENKNPRSTSFFITQWQRENVSRLPQLFGTSNVSETIRLLLRQEVDNVNSRQHNKRDFVYSSGTAGISIRLYEADRQAVTELRKFYDAHSNSEVIRFALSKAMEQLDTKKDGE